jgi:hypothetical protein
MMKHYKIPTHVFKSSTGSYVLQRPRHSDGRTFTQQEWDEFCSELEKNPRYITIVIDGVEVDHILYKPYKEEECWET